MTMLRTPTTRSAPLPVFRAAVFAVVGTVLGVSAHHLVAGGPAPWRSSVAAAVLLFAVGLAGTRRPRSLAAVVVTSATAQTGLHVWLTAVHARPSGATSAVIPMTAHAHRAMSAHGTWPGRPHDSAAMTALHAVAAVLVAVLLHRADAACWSLARGLTGAVDAVRARIATVRALLDGLPVPTGRGSRARRPRRTEPPPLWAGLLANVVVRRGPPPAGSVHAH
ncbi:hypothetical protein ACOT81_39915 [Streptomyces sp. WI04-05B]|uniref:hypothetical protein n=1 Tax=Streptomyces TaxID=1883 RepID=UPI0029B413C5|nr:MULTISPECIES: hypothetical protein [unclassified Streptomyces]MDX2548523.1 hypothetical protein [Streptomyces sp. WI04-05B]MDX2582617.1 hypothetical protein [Streptomyces sp. WI04-05A]MDX3747068.1 hypothetical protein [Streptomyces sp. AK08-02]